MSSKEQYVELDECIHWIENGIMFTSYKVSEVITLDVAKKMLAARLSLLEKGQKLPYVVDARMLKKMAPKPRKYIGNEGSEGVSHCAIIVDSQVSVLIANFFLLFVDLYSTPCKLFTDNDKAIKWVMEMSNRKV